MVSLPPVPMPVMLSDRREKSMTAVELAFDEPDRSTTRMSLTRVSAPSTTEWASTALSANATICSTEEVRAKLSLVVMVIAPWMTILSAADVTESPVSLNWSITALLASRSACEA